MKSGAERLKQAKKEERGELARDRHSLERPSGLSIGDRSQIETRANEARSRAPGISWREIKRALLK